MARQWGRIWLLAWVAISCIWIAAVAFTAFETRPRISLDLSSGDPQVVAAYNRAAARHMIQYLAIALVPPIALFAVLWGVARLGRRASGS